MPSGRDLVQGAVVLFDLDGVIADAAHRQHFLHMTEPDWAGFYDAVDGDSGLDGGRELLASIHPELPVVILTGRVDAVAPRTIEWLNRHGIRWDLLVCRPPADNDDSTPAVDYKRDEVRALLEAGISPVFAVDDNKKIVEMYGEFGIAGMYVSSGYYDNSARYDGGV